MKSGFVQSGSAKINFEIYENSDTSSEVLVFLHGNSESLEYFKKQRDFFEDKYTILLIDSRGHGKSEFGGEKLTLDLMAEDIFCVLNQLRIPKANIIGFSDGANLALILGYKHPQRIKRLVLTGANIKPNGLKFKFWLPTVLSYYMFTLAAQLDKKNEIHRDMLSIMIKEPNISEESLSKITAKTLVVAGENDIIKLKHTKKIAKLIKNSRLEIIKNADHFIPYKMPDVFNELISDFLNETF